MKHFHYFPSTDTLAITLRGVPAIGGEDVDEDIVFSYDDEDRLVLIEIESASKRVDLADIIANPDHVYDGDEEVAEIFTVAEVAEKLGVGSRSIQKTIQAMKTAGGEVGLPSAAKVANAPILLREEDVAAIEKWRTAHAHGRPRARQLWK